MDQDDGNVAAESASRSDEQCANVFGDIDQLPSYARSLLKVNVPVIVNLAEKRQTVSEIVELAPGAIIQFEKSCDDLLELCVGNRPIANGDAVKVGDKFGLRIHEMLMPPEHFASLRRNVSG